jgi:hypothetical protein
VREEEEEEEEMGEPSGHTYLDARYLLYYIYPSSYIYSSIESLLAVARRGCVGGVEGGPDKQRNKKAKGIKKNCIMGSNGKSEKE